MPEGTLQNIPVEQIAPSRTNPRKSFAPADLAELTDSIRAHGIVQPLLVRPNAPVTWSAVKGVTLPGDGKNVWSVAAGDVLTPASPRLYDLQGVTKQEAEKRAAQLNGTRYELVCGERRWRAAKEAGESEVPAIVRPLTDKQMVEIQVIENLQRTDLSPMEEAEGYEQLLHRHGYTAEELAAKIGKSKSYVYARMKLTSLCTAARGALAAGQISPAVALLIARIPDHEAQSEALEQVEESDYKNAASYREARDIIHRDFMLRLKSAPFDPKDADLLPSAGPCSTCPKRTGNQPELFPDVQTDDTCTDPKCFAKKREAFTERKLAEAREAGRQVIEGAAAKRVFGAYGDSPRGSEYVALDDRCDALGFRHEKHWRATLGKKAPEPVLAVAPNGTLKELLPRRQAVQALKDKGLKPRQDPSSDPVNQDYARAKKKKRLKEIAKIAVTEALPKLYTVKGDAVTLKQGLWRMIAGGLHTDIEVDEFVALRRGLTDKRTGARDGLGKWFDAGQDLSTLVGFVIECVVLGRYSESWDPKWDPQFIEACALAGVDVKALEKAHAQENKKTGKRKARRS